MGFSFGVLGLLLMLDIMFVTNFFVVRALRKWADIVVDQDKTKLKDDKEGGKNVEYKASFIETLLFGWVLGKVKPDKLSIHRFPGWKPIPFFAGVTTTSVLVIIALAMLSPQFLSASFGLELGGGALSGNLCNDEEKNATLSELNATLKTMTNFDLTVFQHNIATQMFPLLQEDATRYGTSEHKCAAVSSENVDDSANEVYSLTGGKEQWNDITVYPAAKWGTFFPGYCRAKTNSEVTLDSLKVCGPREICECPRVPDAFPVNIVKSWVGKKLCIMKVCFTFDNIPCGTLTNDANLYPPDNYRAAQMEHAAEMQKIELEKQEYPNIATDDDLGAGVAQTFTKILGQVNLASNIYSIYACLSLYFPSPLDAFRQPYGIAVKQFTFGADKGIFMVMVLAIWWFYDQLSAVLQTPELQLFFHNLKAGDPCFLDGEYILERQMLLANICDTLLPLEAEFGIAANSSTNILNEVEMFTGTDCACGFLGKSLAVLSKQQFSLDEMKDIGFTRSIKDVDAYLPDKDISWLGIKTICEDSEMARTIVLQAPDSEFSGYELWIESGLFATIILKFTMANFIISLLKIADPFVVCAGRFVWIPAKFGLSSGGLNKDKLFADFKNTKEGSLYFINLRGAIFWGFTMHWALWNLMSTAYTTSASDGGIDEAGIAVLQFSMIVAAIVVTIGLSIMFCLKKSGKRALKRRGKGDADGDDDAEESSDEDFDDEDST